MKFAELTPDGDLVAFYAPDVFATENIPTGAAEISDDIWRQWLDAGTDKKRLVDGVLVDAPVAVAPPVVPQSVTMFQARAALIGADLFDQVDAALASDTSMQGKINAQAWEYSAEVRRQSPLIQGLGTALGLTAGQIDDLFIAAGKITI